MLLDGRRWPSPKEKCTRPSDAKNPPDGARIFSPLAAPAHPGRCFSSSGSAVLAKKKQVPDCSRAPRGLSTGSGGEEEEEEEEEKAEQERRVSEGDPRLLRDASLSCIEPQTQDWIGSRQDRARGGAELDRLGSRARARPLQPKSDSTPGDRIGSARIGPGRAASRGQATTPRGSPERPCAG
ncbi:unnamed protein product [Prorocentrum cordatum]|uniref:Uncharacterized protein n=1 Tax=Prorocentrum cordatum TaxID=2364126 RepID=A0ABN9SQ16_9DINO|nr:unnamed protein product [Polarella glacialis]